MDDILSRALACCYRRIKPRTDSIRRGRAANLLGLLWHHRERRKLGTGLNILGSRAHVWLFFFYAVSTKSFEIEALLAGSALMPYFQKQR